MRDQDRISPYNINTNYQPVMRRDVNKEKYHFGDN